MALTGKLEVTIKINQLPSEVTTNKNGWKEFLVELGARSAQVALRPRMWAKLEEAAAKFPHWIGVISGQMGEDLTKGCFRLLEPNLQVFEYKPKAAAPQPAAGAEPTAPPAENKEG